jgi:hypothetical protein
MKGKYGIIAIGITILFVSLSLSSATASPLEEEIDKSITLEYAGINLNGDVSKNTITLTEEEFLEFENSLSELMDELSSAKCCGHLKHIIRKFFFGCKYPTLSKICMSLFNLPCIFRLPISREFIISHGWGYKLNPFKLSDIKIYKPLTFWHYSSRTLLRSKTIIFRPFPFDMKILSGRQMGMMTQFTGIYVYVARQLPQESFTFFMGVARHSGGFDFSLSPIYIR